MPDSRPDTHSGRSVELRKLAEGDQPGAIEFALMLDRAIEAFRSDPEMLRGAVYELARTKLKLQLEQSSPEQANEVLKSLEVAIGKVETFSRSQPALLFRPSDLSGNAGANLTLPPPSPSAFGRRPGGPCRKVGGLPDRAPDCRKRCRGHSHRAWDFSIIRRDRQTIHCAARGGNSAPACAQKAIDAADIWRVCGGRR